MKNKSLLVAGLASIALASCKPNLETGSPSAGPLDLSSYVAVGNSLTAGYADGTLYRSGQENSYPVILAGQFATVGGGAFKVPYLPAMGDMGFPGRKRILGYTTDCTGVTSLGPVLEDSAGLAASNAANSVSIAAAGPYNNTGVPGIRAIDYLFPLYGSPSYNYYAARFYTNPNPLTQINLAKATFFTAWIGNNDVLGYALAGGEGKGSNGTVADLNSISSVPVFSVAVDSVLNRMTANGAKGAVINIPDVTTIPYVTTIPAMGLNLRQGQADSLNFAYTGTGITFTAGLNYWVVQDTTVPVIKMRKMKAGEYLILTLPQDSLKCGGWGSKKPIPKRYVLDAGEIDNIKTATTTFNQILKDAAAARNLAYVDVNTYFTTFQTGVTFNGVAYNTVFVSGGTFSLDGVHLTPRGYAIAANKIITTVNAFYGSSIPTVDVNNYPGVKFP